MLQQKTRLFFYIYVSAFLLVGKVVKLNNMFTTYLIGIFVFIFGACIGSFLNCVIYRSEQEKSLKGRSFCPNCKHELSWPDLFPVFSFLFLKGKCRYCKSKISWRYPLVELLTALIFLLIFNLQISNLKILNIAFAFYIACVLIIIFVYDLKHYIIPDKILFPAIGIVGLVRILDFSFGILTFNHLLSYFFAVIVAAGFFLAIFLVSKGKWMGFGDVKLAVLMGLLLGLINVLVALFLAFFFGAIIGITLMAFRGKKLKSEIPFGPFLILGTFMAMFWASQIIKWYVSLIIK